MGLEHNCRSFAKTEWFVRMMPGWLCCGFCLCRLHRLYFSKEEKPEEDLCVLTKCLKLFGHRTCHCVCTYWGGWFHFYGVFSPDLSIWYGRKTSDILAKIWDILCIHSAAGISMVVTQTIFGIFQKKIPCSCQRNFCGEMLKSWNLRSISCLYRKPEKKTVYYENLLISLICHCTH